MTSHTPSSDTATFDEAAEQVQEVSEAPTSAMPSSEAPPDDSRLGRTFSISPHQRGGVQVPYDVRREREYRENRIANLGLPPSITTSER